MDIPVKINLDDVLKLIKKDLDTHGPYPTIVTLFAGKLEGVDVHTLKKEDGDKISFNYYPYGNMKQACVGRVLISEVDLVEPSGEKILEWILKLIKEKKEKSDKESSRLNTLISEVMSKKAEAGLESR